MDYGHGVECLCRKCCEMEVNSLAQDIGLVLLGVAGVMILGILIVEKFNIKKILGKFF